MAFFIIEIYRADASVLEGHFHQVFPDGVKPPIPESPRLARGEVSNRTAAQLRAFIRSGVGKIKLGLIPLAVRNQIKTTRDFSFTAAQIAPYIAVDKDPATITGRKFELNKDIPGKPAGTVFAVDPADPVPRVRCITDPLHWYDLSIFDAASAPVPVKPSAAQGFDVVEF